MKKLTKNQQLVFDQLVKNKTPQSAYDILDDLRAEGLRAPLQVYRALDKLVEFDLVHRLESMNAFVACAHDHDEAHHHHHGGFCAFAICNDCGSVNEFNDPVIAGQLQNWAGNEGFKTQSTTVELRGLCEGCQPN
ncbi:Fe2+/Zn2+ uptake regulation protein [Candidatus Terasakiella magnetica]|uniref:Fe2+/Zn2+ uptake regulation protein n=1 Tax=Candidatus Terasakiella magnetica TaxID=1867952 RepID=A0A1C3RFI6_9PROT|nr:Fur family transcriptional regulator [Candidatus Terasakiella magnetica]SCA55982.1 Fe2+/Zn2+ uptake regulation protein [Candidatus Terasakiella magnetica]